MKLRRSTGTFYSGWVVVLLCGCSLSSGRQVPAPHPQRDDPLSSLDRRMEHFLASFDSLSAEGFVAFFPRSAEIVYQHTSHTPAGVKPVLRRLSPAEIPATLRYSGPLWASFQFQFEGQPIGLLVQQVMVRTGRWRRVGEFRFVPPDADDDSPTFVEWCPEGAEWVICGLGDETFVDVPLPTWMSETLVPGM